ncbi:MAG: hypothetical protein H6565_15735 [Lewinellaceae bacterium]|nr:hypothetical protein [Lewinellaceae bacterium]
MKKINHVKIVTQSNSFYPIATKKLNVFCFDFNNRRAFKSYAGVIIAVVNNDAGITLEAIYVCYILLIRTVWKFNNLRLTIAITSVNLIVSPGIHTEIQLTSAQIVISEKCNSDRAVMDTIDNHIGVVCGWPRINRIG